MLGLAELSTFKFWKRNRQCFFQTGSDSLEWDQCEQSTKKKKDKDEKEKHIQGEKTLENLRANSQNLDHRGFDISERKEFGNVMKSHWEGERRIKIGEN